MRMLGYVISKYANGKGELITFDELKLFVLDKPEMIDKQGMHTTKIHETDDSLTFRVEMKKGNKWNLHLHDCWEVIIVYKGQCIDWENKMTIDEKHQAIIKPNTLHEIECLTEEALLYVEFKKKIK